VIALSVKLDDSVPLQEMTPNHWAFADARFDMPMHWREWLGTIRTEESSKAICSCSVRGAGNRRCRDCRAKAARGALLCRALLASPFAPAHKPVMLAGYRQHGKISVRSQDDYDPAIPSVVRYYPPVTFAELQLAAKIASQIAAIETASLADVTGGSFASCTYTWNRTIRDNMDRLHQYCRCIEGLIVSEPGQGKNRFKSRTELFIGPRHRALMGEAYDVRSDVEHLYENKYLEVFDRASRLELTKKLEMMEYIARSTLVRILLNSKLWPHFANTDALKAFWALSENERRTPWGVAINPTDALAGFDPRYISDAHLGGP
jgi:hypothetical protein